MKQLFKRLFASNYLKEKYFWLILFLPIIISVIFWTQSRLPALDDKAQISDRINISAIAFDVLMPVDKAQPLIERIIKSAVNWGYTNWKGMLFGILFAASILSLLQILPKFTGTKNRYLNSFYGLVMGAPLSVCVNCATPIAQGMIRAGTSLEISLSMLLSSPVLNPIVLAMAFSILPFHVALIKVIASILFILLIIPILTRFIISPKSNNEVNALVASSQTKDKHYFNKDGVSCEITPKIHSWSQALFFSIKLFFKNLFTIIRLTLPLMILAGLLGSTLFEILPQGSLSNLSMSPVMVFVVALVGTFLPVPIAFDILSVNALISAGLPIGLAGTLLFTLGIFSIFPAMIISRAVSLKLGLSLFLFTIVFGIAAGFITHTINSNIIEKAKITINSELEIKSEYSVFTDAVKACSPLKKTGHEQACLKRIFSSGLFKNVVGTACQLSPAHNDIGDAQYIQAAEDLCRQSILLHKTTLIALEEKDISRCKALLSDEFIDNCMLEYVRNNAYETSSIHSCNMMSSENQKNNCISMIIDFRVRMKSKEACDIKKFTKRDKKLCYDKLNAFIASEFKDIEVCKMLTSTDAQLICQRHIAFEAVSARQNYEACDQLTITKLVNDCKDLSRFDQAKQTGDASICLQLPVHKQPYCQMDAVLRILQKSVENRHLGSLVNHKQEIEKSLSVKSTNRDENIITATPLIWSDFFENASVSISYTNNMERKITKDRGFKKVPAKMVGIDNPWKFDMTDFMEPFVYGKGVASGDFNNDGWPDLLLASNNGIALYKNLGNGKFHSTRTINSEKYSINSFVVAFVDYDNDGWQDIFLSTYGNGNYFLKNNHGSFNEKDLTKIPDNKGIVTLAASFSDLDFDGDLDFILGNWSYGSEGGFIPKYSDNIWYYNNDPVLKKVTAIEKKGETLSVLASDINNDNVTDILIANDRKDPDIIYLGKSNGEFKKINKDMGLIMETSFNTMSYDSADFNNDLLLDVFSTDMSVGNGNESSYCNVLTQPGEIERCKLLLSAEKALGSLSTAWCGSLKSEYKIECYTAMAIKLAQRDKNKDVCEKIHKSFSGKKDLCINISHKITALPVTSSFDVDLPQKESNKLLMSSSNGKLVDKTKIMGVSNSYWSWTGKAADLDNDEWNDIYVANGFGFGELKNINSNVFYHNKGGNNFIKSEKEFGLTNYTNTPSYTYLDYDLDGDIDIISTGVMASPSLFKNEGTNGASISFVLRDEVGNKFCIGCKVIINYSDGKKNQIRELKLGGGFMSYDEPVAYFGLNKFKKINGIKIIWSTGDEWELTKTFPSGRRYRITRNK